MAYVQNLVTLVELVSPTGSTVATLSPTELTWTQDEANAPTLIGRTTVVMPTAAQFAMMKPGAGYFVRVGAWVSTQGAQTYLLKITDRQRTALGLVELQFGGPELDLMAYTPSARDTSAWAKQPNVGDIADLVMRKVYPLNGANYYGYGWTAYGSSAFGELDWANQPQYRTYSAVTNLISNSGFESGTISGWTPVNCTAQAVSGSWSSTGAYAIRLFPSTSATNSYVYATVNVEPNTTYTISATIRVGQPMTGTVDSAARRILVTATVNGSGYEIARSTQGPNTTNGTQRLSRTFTTPAVLDSNQIIVRLYHGQSSTGYVGILWDDVLLVEGDGIDTDGVTAIPYFDGSFAAGQGGYNYTWQGTVQNSPSARTPIVARDPDSLTWTPGQTAWDFLQPLLQIAGLRLWSDGYVYSSNAGFVFARYFLSYNEFGFKDTSRRALQDFNLFDVAQIDSLTGEFSDGTPMYADQVILHYTWNDSLNRPQEAYDVYPTAPGRKPYFKELEDTPFPGPGRAQGIYNRISARASIVQGTTWFDRATFPGKQLAITADAVGGSVVGYVETTTHDPFRGTTEFSTKQTIAYTSKSWFAAAGTWASQTGTWADEA